MKTFIRVNEQNILWENGYANGYVVLPKGHKYNGVHYDDIDVEVHYGLTFSEYVKDLRTWKEVEGMHGDDWVVGFDTRHSSDSLRTWPKEAVLAEVERLKEQLME